MTAAKTDWEIASAAKLKPILEIARNRLGIPVDGVEPYGRYKAKIGMGFIRPRWRRDPTASSSW